MKWFVSISICTRLKQLHQVLEIYGNKYSYIFTSRKQGGKLIKKEGRKEGRKKEGRKEGRKGRKEGRKEGKEGRKVK